MNRTFLSTAGVVAVALGVCTAAPQESRGKEGDVPAVGPRNHVGPDVSLSEPERRQFAKRITVEERTGEAVRAACEHAVKEDISVVFLPAGKYVFDAEIEVPAGLALLGEGSKTVCRAKQRDTHLFRAGGDGVRFTRLKLQGADTSPSKTNNSYGISVSGKQDIRKTHWEFIHNRVGSNDKSHYELCTVDTHPGMDGTFVVEGNLFEDLRHGVGIRDGSGLIRGNIFRNLRTVSNFRPLVAVSITYGTHNNIPVEGCMPHDIEVKDNIFLMKGSKYKKYSVGKAENIVIDGQLVLETRAERPAPLPLPLLVPMDAEGRLRVSKRKPVSRPPE